MHSRLNMHSPARFAAVLAVLLAAALIALVAPRVEAGEHGPEVIRIDGRDRFDTAARIAALSYPDGAAEVIVAAGFSFPDALAASGVAGALDAPILLVNDVRDEPTGATLEALADLDPATVHLAGGTAAISADIAGEVAAAGGWTVERLAGENRFATAAAMASRMGEGGVGEATVILAAGRVAADSLAAGPLAHFAPHPVLLTEADRLPDETAGALEELGTDSVLVLGGSAAISEDVVAEVEAVTGAGSATRLAGETRFDTAVAIAEAAAFSGGPRVLLATGFGPDEVPADALAGGPHGGTFGAELLPINDVRGELPPSIAAYLTAHGQSIDEIVVLGGTAAVSDEIATAAAEAIGNALPVEEDPEAIPVVPGETRIVDTGGAAEMLTFESADLEAGGDYEVALFACGGQSSDAPIKSGGVRYPDREGESADGEFTFRDQDLDDRADDSGSTQNGQARITSVFGAPVDTTQVTATADEAGKIEFGIGVPAGHSGDCAVPVVWLDDGLTPGALALDPASTDSWNTPDENFGVGGAVVFHNGEAPSGTHFDEAVLFLDMGERSLVMTDGHQYTWGRVGDEYRYDGAIAGEIAPTDFERYLSVGDQLHSGSEPVSSYNRDGGSSWQLVGDVAGTPHAVTIERSSTGDEGELEVAWEFPSPLEGNIAQFEVELMNAADLTTIENFTTAAISTLQPFDAPTTLGIAGVDPSLDYVVRVFARGVTGAMGDWSRSSNRLDAEEVPDDPGEQLLLLSQDMIDDRIVVNILDNGDTFVMSFDHEMVPAVDPSINFRWDDGNAVYQVACMTEAMCSWSGSELLDNSQLTMTLDHETLFVSGTEGTGLDISGEGAELIFASSGVQSVGGDPLDIPNSPAPRLSN